MQFCYEEVYWNLHPQDQDIVQVCYLALSCKFKYTLGHNLLYQFVLVTVITVNNINYYFRVFFLIKMRRMCLAYA